MAVGSGPLVIAGGRVLTPSGWVDGDVIIHEGTITEITSAHGAPGVGDLVAMGLLVVPGFVDLQVNGVMGIDLAHEPHRLAELAAKMPRYGVTTFLPTIITSPSHVAQRALDAWRAAVADPQPGSAAMPGLHLEGPMLSAARKGAHPAAHLRAPSAGVIDGWSAKDGVALVTLAPELPGAREVIRALSTAGVVVFAGHTSATADELLVGIDAGVRGLTHLYNAMPSLGHRSPGPIACALTDARLRCGLIVDGVHVDPMVVKLTWNALGPARTVLVSDSVAATGMPAGRYELGGATLVTDGRSVRLEDGTLAGSMLTMDVAVRNLVAFTGCSPDEAIAAATSTPAEVISARTKGRLVVGADADLVLLTQDLHVLGTVVRGRLAFRGGQ